MSLKLKKKMFDDEYYTKKEDWESIKDYIPKEKLIWEAFYGDGKSGEYLKELGFNVINENVDFFENNFGDIVVSNPPYSIKQKVLTRLKEIDKPFILLMPISTLRTKYFLNLFKNNIQLIIPSKRIQYNKPNAKKNNGSPYESIYYCYKINLSNDLIFL